MILKFNRYLTGSMSILAGLLIISLSASVILKSLLIISGILILIITIPNLILSLQMHKGKSYDFIDQLVMIVLALILMFSPISFITKTIGTIIFILALIKLIRTTDKIGQLQRDLYRYIIALILILVDPVDITKVVCWIMGLLLIVTGLILIFNLRLPKSRKPSSKEPIKQGVIDVDDYHVHHD